MKQALYLLLLKFIGQSNDTMTTTNQAAMNIHLSIPLKDRLDIIEQIVRRYPHKKIIIVHDNERMCDFSALFLSDCGRKVRLYRDHLPNREIDMTLFSQSSNDLLISTGISKTSTTADILIKYQSNEAYDYCVAPIIFNLI
jgi:superfamily II DNA/RNA helicase